MKLFSGILAATIVAAALATGCSETPDRMSRIESDIMLSPARTIEVGESTRVKATTKNLVATKALEWTVSPNVGKILVEKDTNGQTALFTADQPGVYVITARADTGNGRIVSSDTTVTVHGRPIVTERLDNR